MDKILIESEKNTFYRKNLALLTGKGIKKYNQFLLMGRKFVEEQYLSQWTKYPKTAALILSSDQSFKTNSSIPQYVMSRQLFNKLDIFGTKSPLLLSQVPDLPMWQEVLPPNGLELLCAMGDPSNLGALIRTAAALSVKKIILLKECCSAFHCKSLRSAAGATLKVQLELGPSISELDGALYTLDLSGSDINKFQWPQDCRLLIGEEGPGLPTSKKNWKPLQIPVSENVESLNAMVAASLAIYSYQLQNI